MCVQPHDCPVFFHQLNIVQETWCTTPAGNDHRAIGINQLLQNFPFFHPKVFLSRSGKDFGYATLFVMDNFQVEVVYGELQAIGQNLGPMCFTGTHEAD